MKEQQTNEKEVIVVDYINKYNYEEYIGKTVKVTGDVVLTNLGLTKLPINFTEVGGSFYCFKNKLSSLEGAPEKVGRDFYCSFNELSSLEGAPKLVGGEYNCQRNALTSLEGSPKFVGRDFDCRDNKLKSTKGKPEFIGGGFIS